MHEPVRLDDGIIGLIERMEIATHRQPVVRRGERESVQHLRYGVSLRDGGRCRWCGSRDRLVLDHIIPWSMGGPDNTTNLRLLCWNCNADRSNYRTSTEERPAVPVSVACSLCRVFDPGEDLHTSFCIVCRTTSNAPRDLLL